MLEFENLSFPTNPKGHAWSVPILGSGTLDVIALIPRDVTRVRVRSKEDRLVQGSVFDRFGNKSVYHREWSGVLRANPPGGGPAKLPGTDTRWWVTDPPWTVPDTNGRQTILLTDETFYVIGGENQKYKAFYFEIISAHPCWRLESGTLVSYLTPCMTRVYCDPIVSKGTWQWRFQVTSLGKPTKAERDAFPTFQKLRNLWHGMRLNGGPITTDYESSWYSYACDRALALIYALYRALKSDLHAIHSRRGTIATTSAPTTWKGALPHDGELPKYVAHDLYRYTIDLADDLRWTIDEKSTITRQIVEQAGNFSSNLLAYCSDLRKTGDTVREILGLSKGISIRSLANLWLSGRFGDRLTLNDTRELFDSIGKTLKSAGKSYQILRTSTTKPIESLFLEKAQVRRVSTVIVANKSYTPLMTAVDRLMRWDAWPTLENLWDLVPFSFVVDWFLAVDDLLGHIDAAIAAPYLRPLSQYVSEKRTGTVWYDGYGWSGQLHLSVYKRAKYNVLADIRPFERTPSVPSFSVVNLIDAGALLVQTFGA